jgi:hypothetical protein
VRKKEVIVLMKKKPTISYDAARDCKPLDSFFLSEEKEEKVKN